MVMFSFRMRKMLYHPAILNVCTSFTGLEESCINCYLIFHTLVHRRSSLREGGLFTPPAWCINVQNEWQNSQPDFYGFRPIEDVTGELQTGKTVVLHEWITRQAHDTRSHGVITYFAKEEEKSTSLYALRCRRFSG